MVHATRMWVRQVILARRIPLTGFRAVEKGSDVASTIRASIRAFLDRVEASRSTAAIASFTRLCCNCN